MQEPVKKIVKICKTCKKEFKTNVKTRKYCSKECCDNKVFVSSCKICGSTTYGKTRVLKCDKCKEDLRKKIEIKNVCKFNIFLRDNFTCVYCGKSSIEDGVGLFIEHVMPEYTDINNSLTNLVTSCFTCNTSKVVKILPQHIVDRITARNKKLNAMFTDEEVDRMQKFFREYYFKNGEKRPY